MTPERSGMGARPVPHDQRSGAVRPAPQEQEDKISLRVRWLGRVPYGEAFDLQRALHSRSSEEHLLLLEHPHVYTLGTRADPTNVLVPPASVGAELVHTDRGGDVTYHGPGQLVGYPIVNLDESPAGMRDVVAYVRRLEAVLIDVLASFGLDAGREEGLTGVWVGGEKIAAIGVRVARGAHDARLRAQRRSRPHDVRPHRPVRHRRARGDVARGAARRRAVDADRRGSRRRMRSSASSQGARSSGRTWRGNGRPRSRPRKPSGSADRRG